MRNVMFTSKKHPKSAIAATVMAALSVVAVLVMIALSAKDKGNAGLFVGIGGVFALLLNVVGCIMSIRAFSKEDIYYTFPIIGTVSNGVILVALLVIYGIGVMN